MAEDNHHFIMLMILWVRMTWEYVRKAFLCVLIIEVSYLEYSAWGPVPRALVLAVGWVPSFLYVLCLVELEFLQWINYICSCAGIFIAEHGLSLVAEREQELLFVAVHGI